MSDGTTPTTPSTTVVVICLLVLGGLAGWFGRGWLIPGGTATGEIVTDEAGFDRTKPDIFFIAIDTLRADHLPFHGYDRMTAPWMTDLSQRSHVFLNATATSSWTVPSVVSYMTGLLPAQHGLSGAPSATAEADTLEIEVLSYQALTLAERLRESGYVTYAIVANAHFPNGSGLEQGFDEYVPLGFKRAGRVALAVERLSNEIRKRRKPVFVYLHYFDPHDPYRKNSPVVYAFDQELDKYQDARKKDESLAAVDRRLLQNQLMDELLQRQDLQVGGDGLTHIEALYDSEIRLVDDHVQLLYGDFGIEDDDVVVITSDHGEEFRDHGELGHRLALYEESLRVPMLISWPAVWTTPSRIPERISQVDLVPTLAELGGATIPDGELPAQSLLPLLDRGELDQRYPVTAELVRTDGVHQRAIYDGPMKLIVDLEQPDAPELYDLVADPGELHNLAPERPAYTAKLAQALDEHLASLPKLRAARQDTTVTPEVRRQLEAMGYIDDGGTTGVKR